MFPHAAKWVIAGGISSWSRAERLNALNTRTLAANTTTNPHKTLRKKTSKQTLDQFKNVIVAVWSFWGHSPGPQQPFDCRNSFESCSQYECILRERGRWVDDASLNLTLIKNTKCDGCGVCVGVQCVGVQGDW